MTATGLKSIDSTIQKTNVWLNDIMDELGTDDRLQAQHGLVAVLHTLRDHLPLNESAQLAAQLPQLIRGMYFEGWKPSVTPLKERRWDEFVAHVSESFALDPDADPVRLTQSVLKVLAKHVSAGEISDVKQCLPKEVRRHWR